MDTVLHRWLRPTLRARRAVAALVVVALLGWVSLTAGHVHLDAHSPAVAQAQTGDGHAPAGGGDRSHPCSLCAAFERAAGPAAAPTLAIDGAVIGARATTTSDRQPLARAVAPYRSRAPPHA